MSPTDRQPHEDDDAAAATVPSLDSASEADRPSSAGQAVGYGKPPAHSRFKPGESGNRRGRPKGSQSIDTIWRSLMARKVTINEGNGHRRVSLVEAILLASSQRAIKGDTRAARMILELGRRVAEALPEDASPTPELDREIIADYFARLSPTAAPAVPELCDKETGDDDH